MLPCAIQALLRLLPYRGDVRMVSFKLQGDLGMPLHQHFLSRSF
jgi:hypothetical protein